ncbi:MAG: hypothetical protein ABR505_11525 [Actinomycetota bacterium]
MPIKGKKKPQARGSQARRRPAAAPRPAYATSRRMPWYRSPAGRGLVVIVALVIVGLGVWAIGSARSNAREESVRREALEEYSGQMRSLLQALGEPATAMSAAPTQADGAGFDVLSDAAGGWAQALKNVAAQAGTIFPPSDLEGVHKVFSEAILLYEAAARTYALAPDAEGKLVDKLLARAADLRDRATAVWEGGIDVLDTARSEVGLDPSGLQSPTALAPPAVPTAVPTIPITPGDEPAGGNNDGGGANDGAGGNGKSKGSGND